jgi:hypothetical protein
VSHATLRSLRPEVGRLWVRRAFRDWPWPEDRSIDLSTGRVRRGGGAPSVPGAEDVDPAAGLLYVPPVDPALAPARDDLIASLAARGVAMLAQVAPGERVPVAVGGPEVVVDLVVALLARDLDALSAVAPGTIALWPLVAGITDGEELWAEGCRRLAAAGVRCVQAIVPHVEPAERRELASAAAEDAGFSRVFHARAGDERRFAAVAARHGLAVLFRRRDVARDRRARNAALAEVLALGGELWLRLGRSEPHGQELFRASRWVDDSTVDVRSLALEGNLDVAEPLRGELAAAVVEEWASTGSSAIVDAWLAEYVESPPER